MIAMMIFIHLIILLTIGFGVGYWLLITASKYEGRLKTIGESLGFTLIALVILSVILGFFSSLKIKDSDYMPGVGQQKTQIINSEDREENEPSPMMNNVRSEDNGETQDESQENENKPIKSNIKDHE